MKKSHILLLLLALLLILSAVGCQAPVTETPEPENEQVPDASGDPSDSDLSPDDFLSTNGYPTGFSITLIGEEGYGFDTANARVFCGAEEKTYNFSSRLSSLYYEMSECNLYTICEASADLTYKAICGEEPSAENETYYLTFTDNGKTYSIKTDKAAMSAYASRSDVSNVSALIKSFSNFAKAIY